MENNQTELKPEQVLRMHFPLMDDEGSNFKRFYFNDAVAAMQEYADLQTASLQAENERLQAELAEMVEALERIDWGWKQKAVISKDNP